MVPGGLICDVELLLIPCRRRRRGRGRGRGRRRRGRRGRRRRSKSGLWNLKYEHRKHKMVVRAPTARSDVPPQASLTPAALAVHAVMSTEDLDGTRKRSGGCRAAFAGVAFSYFSVGLLWVERLEPKAANEQQGSVLVPLSRGRQGVAAAGRVAPGRAASGASSCRLEVLLFPLAVRKRCFSYRLPQGKSKLVSPTAWSAITA